MTTPKILVVDDENDIVEALTHVFRREGWRVVSATDGRAALELARTEKPDLLLLDLMLPEMSGMEVLKHLKTDERTQPLPVVLLTARGEEIDRVLGFELGADDYITKPFSPREVVLRLRVVLKRAGIVDEPREGRILRYGPIEIDLDHHEALVQKRPVPLTVTEFRLLANLVGARGRVRSREALLAEVWGYDSDVLSRTVDTHMRRLRSKLGGAGAWLGTVRGVGYRVQDPSRD